MSDSDDRDPEEWRLLVELPGLGEAHVAKGKLEFEGIPCQIGNEATKGVLPITDSLEGGVQIWVKQEDLRRAREILGLE